MEHHIEESLKQFKIPKGLQINKEYQVMEETENFRIHIREIQLNTEMEIVNAILDHYRPVFRRLCERNKLFIKTRRTISLPLHRNFQRKPS